MIAKPIQIAWNSDLPILASEVYLSSLGNEYGWIGGYYQSGKLCCILPYVIIRKPLLRLVRFTTQPIYLGEEINVEDEKEFLNCVVDHFRNKNVDVIIPSSFNAVFRTYPEGAIAAPYGNYIINLQQPEEVLWKNIHQKHRNVIRNAIKKGVKIINYSNQLEIIFKLVRGSFIRSARNIIEKIRIENKLKYQPFIKQIIKFRENVKILIAEYEGMIQGCAVIPFSNHTAYYMHGGSISNPVTGAMNLLQWEAIRIFREMGVHYYDFFGVRINPELGSKAEGIAKFKERFGGEFIRGYMWKYYFSPLKYNFYSLAAHIRSGGDVVDQEIRKSKL